MLDNLRPPPREELVEAWRAFFQAKSNTRVPLNSTQAIQCCRLLEYLLHPAEGSATSSKPGKSQLEYKDIMFASKILRILQPREKTANHLELAKALYSAVTSDKPDGQLTGPYQQQWGYYIKTLCLYGGSKSALQMLYADWDAVLHLTKFEIYLVNAVMQGLAKEGCEEDLVKLVEFADQNGIPYDRAFQLIITEFFTERDRIPETKHWFTKETASNSRLPDIYRIIASFAARNDLQDWAVPFFLSLSDSKPDKLYWDSLLQAILLVGKGLKEVEMMMSHMANSKGPVKPNTTTINGLLRVAVELKDPLLAEEILSLATDRGLKPDGETYMILVDLRLGAGYLPGVHAAMKKVKHSEPWQQRPQLWPTYVQLVNRYLSAVSAQKQPDFKLITGVLEMAEEESLFLYPETVASISTRLLENEQHFDVMDILSVYAFQYSAPEREIVQDAFIKFCLTEASTSRAWGCYQILRQLFQDLSFDHRVQLMKTFLDRKRPDMASHVFGHMRQHRNSTYHPKLETYITFFEGLGRSPDQEALEMVYNMLKMDTVVQPNTKLYTSLIIAHAACDKPVQALDFWNEITTSREGPSYASLEAIFWALERKPGGSKMARKVWKRIEKMDIEIPPAVYNAYIGAMAGSGEEQEVQNIIMRMRPVVECDPDAMT